MDERDHVRVEGEQSDRGQRPCLRAAGALALAYRERQPVQREGNGGQEVQKAQDQMRVVRQRQQQPGPLGIASERRQQAMHRQRRAANEGGDQKPIGGGDVEEIRERIGGDVERDVRSSSDADSGADALFLNHYGLDGANSLSQAIEAGLDQDMELLLPLYNRPMAEAAGGAIDGIFGTIAWDSQIDNTPSSEFTEAFSNEYDGRVPSGPAQLAYAQTLQYAAAVERAGTFYPPEVIRALEDYEYDNIGMGAETMRGCDHQAQRDIPVVRGLPAAEQGEGQYFEIINVTSRDDVGYGCDSGPAAECELGEYGDE